MFNMKIYSQIEKNGGDETREGNWRGGGGNEIRVASLP
jgi:hypothetical protein